MLEDILLRCSHHARERSDTVYPPERFDALFQLAPLALLLEDFLDTLQPAPEGLVGVVQRRTRRCRIADSTR